jgi:hypothetical protein
MLNTPVYIIKQNPADTTISETGPVLAGALLARRLSNIMEPGGFR